MATVTVRPNGVGAADAWTLIGGGTKYGAINNDPAIDGRLIRAGGPGIIQALTMDDMPSDVSIITSATIRARVTASTDVGVLARLRTNLVVAGDPTPTKGTVFSDFGTTAVAEFTIGTISGLTLTKSQGDAFIVQCRAEDASGWVLGNGTLDVTELYLDVVYTRTTTEKTISSQSPTEKTIASQAPTEKTIP